jgi:hypothetical protein
MKQTKIDLYCCSSTDFIYDTNGNLIDKRRGGPRFFIEKVLKQIDADYKSLFSREYQVNITVDGGGECGSVNNRYSPAHITEMNNRINVISTILDDIYLDDSVMNGKIFLDIQGYYRSVTAESDNYWDLLRKIQNKIYCLKGNQDEIMGLPKDIYDSQKNGMLIITKGSDGVEMYVDNIKYTFGVDKIIAVDTVGAGDTLFGAFVGGLSKGMNYSDAMKLAVLVVSNFLQEKKATVKNGGSN